MHSTTNPKPTDDPHDVLVVTPDVALMAPTDEELSRLARSLRPAADPQARAAAGLAAGPAIPTVDTTFRPAATGEVENGVQGRIQDPGRRTMGARATHAILVAAVIAACTAGAKVAWHYHGSAAEAMIAQWTPQRVLASLLPSEKPTLAAQPAAPAVEAAAAAPAILQSGSPAPTAVEGDTPAATAAVVDPAPSLGAITTDLASARQEIERLKASIEELKASQLQMSRDIAKASEAKVSEIKASVSEPNPRSKLSAHPRAPVAPVRRPISPPPPQQAAAYPAPPPPAAPYVPRQVEPPPPTTAQTLADPELASVPRPPMPLR